jgi:hypothetical protein
LNPASSQPKSAHTSGHDLLNALPVLGAEHLVSAVGDEIPWAYIVKHNIESMVFASVYVTEDLP